MSQRVFLPPASVLRRILPTRPPTPPARAEPTPAPQPKAKDRISIGPPSEERSKAPLILRREDDLTKMAKGRPDALPSPQASPAGARVATPAPEEGPAAQAGRPGLRQPAGLGGTAPSAEGRAGPRPGASAPSIGESLRNLERRLRAEGPRGLPAGTTVQQIGGFSFDPEGADFTFWLNHFKDEVYRNWIVPQPAMFGMRGHVDLEFTVERDGTLGDIRLLKSSGTPAMDRAAQNALLGSRALPLPADYAPQRLRMQVTFFYNEGPQGS